MSVQIYPLSITNQSSVKINNRILKNSLILSASKNTTFIFQIENIPIDRRIANQINSFKSISERVNFILNQKGRLKYHSIENKKLLGNLLMSDSYLPQILSEVLLNFYLFQNPYLSTITNALEQNNPLKYSSVNEYSFYQHKIKRFLKQITLGMNPSMIWMGNTDTVNNFLIAEKIIDEYQFRMEDSEMFGNFLLKNTMLEIPGKTKHDHGKIYIEDDDYYFKLNLQIRFKA